MASTPSEGDYPQPAVQPELFAAASPCNTALPVGEVIEWFDFGQFVELFATDASGVSHPLVLTQDDAVLQATLRVKETNGGQPAREVDLSGGVPINRVVAGDGLDAFKTVTAPQSIVVEDVDDLVTTGRVTTGGTTYEVTLRQAQIDALRDGERIVLRGRVTSGGSKQRVWLQLTPKVLEVRVLNLDELLADQRVTVGQGTEDAELITLKLEPVEVAALLAGRTVVVRGTSGSKARLVRLRQGEGIEVGFAARPALTDYAIKDLAAFLSNPVIPGLDNLLFKVPLNAAVVQRLRTAISAQIDLGDGQLLTLRLEEARP